LVRLDLEHDPLEIVWLLHPHIDRADHVTDLVGNGIGHLLVRHLISSDNLDIDRRRKTEVNCFGHDVGRKEIEDDAGIVPVKAETQVVHIVSGRL